MSERESNQSAAPLLVTRKQARHLLAGVHSSTIWRWEKLGRLVGRRLHPNSKTGRVFYLLEDIERLARGEAD